MKNNNLKKEFIKIGLRVFGLFLILTSLIGCLREYNCLGFPKEYLSWVPYARNDYMAFSNGKDTSVFIVDEAYYSEPRSYMGQCNCGCGEDAYFVTQISIVNNLQIRGMAYYHPDDSEPYYEYIFMKYAINDGYYFPNGSDDYYFPSEEYGGIEYLPSYTVDGIEYKNVIELELDTILDDGMAPRLPDIWRIYLADSIGLIQFEYFENKDIWKLIPQ